MLQSYPHYGAIWFSRKDRMMRAEIVHVTDHALLRWRQRAARRGDANVYEIINAVKQSRIIKKHEPMPFLMPRLQDSVYSYGDGVLFILKSISIDEYDLVTVITSNSNSYRCNFSSEKVNRKQNKYEKRSEFVEYHDYRFLMKSLAMTPKNHHERKIILDAIHESEELLSENYSFKIENNDQKVFYDRSKAITYIVKEFSCLKERISAASNFFQMNFDVIWKKRQISMNNEIHPAA